MEPTNPTPTTPVKRNRQDTAVANNIAAALELHTFINNLPDLKEALRQRAYTDQRLQAYLTSQQTAQTAYQNRDLAILNQQETHLKLKTLDKEARQQHSEYRKIMRPALTDPAHIAATQLKKIPSKDLQIFITETTTIYKTILQTPDLLALCANNGYTTDTLNNHLAKLTALATQQALYQQTRAQALAATQTRDEAYQALQTEVRQLKALITVVAKNRQDWQIA